MGAMAATLRGSLGNLETGETRDFQYNPTEIKIALAAVWKESSSPAASFERLAFANRKNDTYSFKLVLDGKARGAPDINDYLAYLASLMAPPDADLDVRTAAPPRILFRFPNFISVVTVLPKLNVTAKRFDPDTLAPDYVELEVELLEHRTKRLGAQTLRRLGFIRVAA